MLTATKVRDLLLAHGVTHIVGLPDNLCRTLFSTLKEEPAIEVIGVSREGETFAIAAGLHIGGKKPVVLIQNTGLLEAGDAYRGTSWHMHIPQVILLAYRGFASLAAEVERKDTVAEFTEPTLKAWSIPYEIMQEDEDLKMLSRAFELAESTNRPAAAIIAGTTQ